MSLLNMPIARVVASPLTCQEELPSFGVGGHALEKSQGITDSITGHRVKLRGVQQRVD